MKLTFIEKAYSVCISLALILHVFNNFGFTEELKYFHVPAAAAFVLSFFLPARYDSDRKRLVGFLVWSVLVSLVSMYARSFNAALPFAIVLGACIGVKYVRGNWILHICNALIPIDILYLLAGYFLFAGRTYYRYAGFYNDSNYLCVTLIAMCFLIVTEFQTVKNKIIKLGLLFEIPLIVYLVTTTVSRTGLVCIGIILLMTFYSYFKRFKWRTVLICVVGITALYQWKGTAIDSTINMYLLREETGDAITASSENRFGISWRGVEYVLTHPAFLIQGLGIGAVNHPEAFPDYYTNERHIDHNTITSIFSEQGLVGFVLYVMLMWGIFKPLWQQKRTMYGRIRFFSFLALSLFSASINVLKFLPFWFAILYIARQDEYLNNE